MRIHQVADEINWNLNKDNWNSKSRLYNVSIANVEINIYIPTMKKPSDSLALYDYIHEIGAAAIKIAQNHNTSSSVIVIFLYLQVSAQFSRS